MPKQRASRRSKRPQRLSVPVSEDDLAYLRQLATATTLPLSVVSRLLLHRGVRLHKADGQLTE